MFEPKLPPLLAKNLHLKYAYNDIVLKFIKPSLSNIPLNGSSALIENIISENKTILKLDLKIKTLIQKELLDILKFYGVDLPIYQISGENNIDAKLEIPFNKNKVKVSTMISSSNTKIAIDGKSILFDMLDVKLKDNIIKTKADINDNNYSLSISNQTNLNENISTGIVKVNHLIYKDIVEVKDEKISYNIDYNSDIIVKVDDYRLTYILSKSKHNIKIDNLNKLLKFIQLVDINSSKQSTLTAHSSNNFKTAHININNLHLSVNSNDDEALDNNTTSSLENILLPELYCNLFSGSVSIKNKDFQYDTLNINLKDSIVNATYKKDQSVVSSIINVNSKKVIINSHKITDKFVNKLLKKEILNNGYLSLFINGTLDELNGKIKFHTTTIQNVIILNNLITFINTTPAIINPILALPTLFRLGETNFDLQGYYIESGWLDFNYNLKNKLLKVNDLYTNSKMMDFKVKGQVDFNTKTLKTKVDVIFMKDHSKFLNNIPLVGYIITGEDGNFVTQVDIYGSIDSPQFETHTVKNASEGMVNAIKRTITLPNRFFNAIFDTNTTKEHEKQHQKVIDQILDN